MSPGPMGGGPGGRGHGHGKPKDTKKTIKRLLGYLSDSKAVITIAFICVLLSAGSSLAGSYMLRPIINKFIQPLTGAPGDPAGLFGGVCAMAGIYLIGVIATYAQSRLMIGLSQKTLKKIRDELFSKMQKLPVRFFDTNNTGDLMSRYTNDVDTIGMMLDQTLVQMFSGIISLIGTLGLMIYTNIWLTLVTVVMIPLLIKVATTIAGHSRRYFRDQQKALGDVNGYIEETVSGQKVVKVFCHEEECEKEFAALNEELKKSQIKAQFAGGMMGPVMGNLSQLNYSLTACIGAVLCVLRGFDVGGLTVFVNYSRQFSRPINELSMQVTNIMSALAGAERVFRLMDEEPEPEDVPDAVELQNVRGNVDIDHVTFGYNPDKTILKDVSIYAKPGQKIALVGSTGAGKTTITNLITRFYGIDAGRDPDRRRKYRPHKEGQSAGKYRRGTPGYPSVYGHGDGEYPLRPP